jgi:hypothetical protein
LKEEGNSFPSLSSLETWRMISADVGLHFVASEVHFYSLANTHWY